MSTFRSWFCLAACAALPFGARADDSVTGLRSDLWQMEYREEDEEKKDVEPEERTLSANRVHVQLPPETSAGDIGTTPGEVTLEDLQEEAVLADWNVDAGTKSTEVVYRPRSSWNVVEADLANGATTVADGPSIVTLLVAVVACAVVTGAMFSGREEPVE